MRCHLYSFVFLFLSCLPNLSFSQVIPAQKVLISSGKLEEGNFEIHRYEGDGERNTSSASGPGFYISGGTLEEIFVELWPDFDFKIARKYSEDLYTLRISTKGNLNESILDQIWNQISVNSQFTAIKSTKNQTGNCLQVRDPAQLSKYVYQPTNGVIKKDESKSGQIQLLGYSLKELAAKLSESKRLGKFFRDFDGVAYENSYSFRLNSTSLDALRESLERYGLDFSSCTQEVLLYELK